MLDMLDRNPGKTLAELKNELPRTWQSPTMSPHCDDELKYGVVDRMVKHFEKVAANGGELAGQKIRELITVNGIRIVLDDGTWGLVRASSDRARAGRGGRERDFGSQYAGDLRRDRRRARTETYVVEQQQQGVPRIYVTFAVAYLREGGASTTTVSIFWLLLGATSILFTAVSARLITTGRGPAALAVTNGICAAAVLILVLGGTTGAALISAALFGSVFLAVVTAMTQLVRDGLPSSAWAGAIGRLTVAFGIGQIFGPLLAGVLGDTTAGLRLGLAMSAAVLVCAALISATVRRPGPGTNSRAELAGFRYLNLRFGGLGSSALEVGLALLHMGRHRLA